MVSAAKDVIALDKIIRSHAHEALDTRRQKAWMALEAKAEVLNYFQEKVKLGDAEFYREFAGRIQGLKTANVTIGGDGCVVEHILISTGLTMDSATQAEKEAALKLSETQAVVMLYFRNIHQGWHGTMVRYLEDAYATGNDLYPKTLPDSYKFLDDWKARHRGRRGFAGRSEGITLATLDQDEKGKRDERFVVPGKEHVLCWDCNFYGHGRGNKICPNFDPSKAREGKGQKQQVTNVTASGSQEQSSVTQSGATPASGVSWSTSPAAAAAEESVHCTVQEESWDHHFTFIQGTSRLEERENFVLLDNQSTCHVFKSRELLKNIQQARDPIAIHSTGGTAYANEVGFIENFSDPIYVCDEGIANILSFAKIRDSGCGIAYDSTRDCFIV